jgi:hypothetical protein
MKITRQSNEAILLTQIKYIKNLQVWHEIKKCASVITLMTEIKLTKHLDPNYKCLKNALKQYLSTASEWIALPLGQTDSIKKASV